MKTKYGQVLNTWEAYSYRKASANLLGGAGPAGTGYAVYKESSDGQMAIEYMDGFGRSVQSTRKGFDGNWIAITRTYRRTGTPANLEQVIETYPYFLGQAVGGYTVSQTDILGRSSYLYQTKSGGGEKVATITYNGLETSQTNFKSQIKKEIYNAKGWLLEARWNDGNNLYYGYDAESRLTVIRDIKGNTILNTYNARGDKTQTFDPDMGTYQYVYNAFGEVIKQTYPNGDIVTMEYDKLGRVTKKVENEGTTIYVYDTKAKGIGKPAEINSFAVNKSFAYDNLGRLNQEQTTISGKTYQTTRTFDSQGRLYDLTYPSGFTMRHLYNNNGYLSQLKNAANNADLWVVELMDASGNVTKQRFGNGIVTEKQIEATTQYLTSIRSTLNNNVVQQYSYNYDDLGNLTRRQDVRRNKSENFSYDAINRLTQSQIAGATAVTMSYDELGNILSKSDVGAFEYGSTNAGPHRIVKVRSNTPTVPCSFQLNIGTEYNSFNKVKRISNDTAYVEITYGPDQLRIQQKMYVRGVLARTKTYISGLVEIEEFPNGRTKTTTYLSGKGVLIQDKAANGAVTSTISYYLKDHLGSITGIANAAGTLTEEPSFDAWGNRRNADWTPLAQTYQGTERGFTEHEHYDLFSMIDMNGRVYDPILGRFLSPDPFIQDITNLQSLNRYSYVFNNPLNYIDPSGYMPYDPYNGLPTAYDSHGRKYGILGTIPVNPDGSIINTQTSAPIYSVSSTPSTAIQAVTYHPANQYNNVTANNNQLIPGYDYDALQRISWEVNNSTRHPVNQLNNVSQDGVYLGAGISTGNDYSTNQTSSGVSQVSNNQEIGNTLQANNNAESAQNNGIWGQIKDEWKNADSWQKAEYAKEAGEGFLESYSGSKMIGNVAGGVASIGLGTARLVYDLKNKNYRGAAYDVAGLFIDTGFTLLGPRFSSWDSATSISLDYARENAFSWGMSDTFYNIYTGVSDFNASVHLGVNRYNNIVQQTSIIR